VLVIGIRESANLNTAIVAAKVAVLKDSEYFELGKE